MCGNCDGRIAIEASICPYCGAEQSDADSGPSQIFKNQSLQDSLTSLYTPPYSQQKPTSYNEEPAPKKMEAFKEVKSGFSGLSTATTMPTTESQEGEEKAQNNLMPILMLSLGGNLFILGLLQFFFSKGGFLRLEWDASYWFLYALASLPLLYLGFKKASKFK